ncbi:hypothetical protein BV22DRAFT_62742 [Leucogyrophana mollusca]|uniref:Uncharacterized protein n=1 Tax=Leucogyrophana mollusca TaxID=85980 RepID=A0ACB8C094_9AGAM|nr:hypothetical protein BV22DRAFT_62742 [Leucogyrophana mollusca]
MLSQVTMASPNIDAIAVKYFFPSSSSLETFPDETLLQISQCVEETGYGGCISLSCVNRRLRRVILRLLFRKIVIRNSASISRLPQFFRSREEIYASSLQCMRFGKNYYVDRKMIRRRLTLSNLADICRLPSLPNLSRLECLGYGINEDQLYLFASSVRLRSLAFLWEEAALFPDLHAFPLLEDLRIYHVRSIGGIYSIKINRNADPTFLFKRPVHCAPLSNLTTFVMHDASSFFGITLEALTLPNLRVVSLQKLVVQPWIVFYFVQRHPALEEVNIGLDECVNFGAYLKLILGQGNFEPPDDPDDLIDRRDPTDVYPYHEVSMIWSEVFIGSSFAFSRKPLLQHDVNSWHRSYDITALGLEVAFSELKDGIVLDRFYDLLSSLGATMPVEELLLVRRTGDVCPGCLSECDFGMCLVRSIHRGLDFRDTGVCS